MNSTTRAEPAPPTPESAPPPPELTEISPASAPPDGASGRSWYRRPLVVGALLLALAALVVAAVLVLRGGEPPIQGVVKGPEGPAKGLDVELYQGKEVVESVKTDADGKYVFEDVEPGTYTLITGVPMTGPEFQSESFCIGTVEVKVTSDSSVTHNFAPTGGMQVKEGILYVCGTRQ